jgi:hypothetical protein
MSFQSYRKLEIYKKAHKLAVEIHGMSLNLPMFEMYEEYDYLGRMISTFIKSVEIGHKV